MGISHITRQTSIPLFRVIWEKQTYMNMLYLLASFPLGLTYFMFLVPGITAGLVTLVIWIGVFILVFMRISWWQMAAFERYLAMHWLHVTIPAMSYPSSVQMTLWQRLQAQVKNSMTWKTLAFVLLKFPISTFFFIITVVLLVLSVAVMAVSLIIGLLSAPFFTLILTFQRAPNAGERLQQYLLFAATGCGLGPSTLHLFNYLALVDGQLARVMLGMSDTALRLEEAEALSAQERARAELAEQRRKQLVVNVSHELRAPVASISGHLESLLMITEEGTTAPPPATLYNYLRIAHQEVERLAMLVDDLLSLARMEAGELRLNVRAIAAQEALEEVYRVLSPLALRERQVTLVRGANPKLPPVLADQQRLVQILLNLVRNAITSTPAGGIVSLTLEPADGQHLALIVADNGIGIPAEDLKHIFERFYRVDTARSRTSGGFGLGLAIVHDLVTAMGGTIKVESTEGQGSRFCVLLRIAKPN